MDNTVIHILDRSFDDGTKDKLKNDDSDAINDLFPVSPEQSISLENPKDPREQSETYPWKRNIDDSYSSYSVRVNRSISEEDH